MCDLDRTIGVEAIARAADVSRSQLTRLYERHFGQSPARRLQRRRGGHLIRDTGL